MNEILQPLQQAVQRNCHITDARHGADFGMCVYLMKMREYYRWEQGLAFDAHLPKVAVGDWLVAREGLWSDLAEAEFQPVPVAGRQYDPFDTQAINRALEPLGLVYSAGLVHGAKPHFFLGQLDDKEAPSEGFSLWVSGRELARCLSTPPAMNAGHTIFLRRESLRRLLWEKLESWRWRRLDNAMGRALACYPFDSRLDFALDQMTGHELAAAREHEIGEYHAGQLLGQAWNGMLMDVAFTPAELMARAVRDHLADCSRTLPMLLDEGREASIHFFIGNLGAMRRQLFPSLTLAYEQWRETRDEQGLIELAKRGEEHWRDLALDMLGVHGEQGEVSAPALAELVESRLL